MSEAGSDSRETDRTNERGDATRVLIVEDEPDVAELYCTTVEAEGYDVDVANSVSAGADRLSPAYDIALLDRRLPDGHGEDLLTTIRDRELDIRVGMVTAVEPDFDIVEMGFDLYVLKPLSQGELIDAVERLGTRSEYDDRLQRTAALASKRATLEAEKPREALERSEKYQQLTAELAELDAELERITEQFDTQDYRRLFEDIGA
ncbi:MULTISPECIES: HalX domain-containing protein [Halolamina]|uniref:DNA-binding response regulator, OmpR family, contains REC and winged-helix (WHTH) domain n=1 Tax=Halolamina pelagica TaxID=699431 RepID=A0A1I5RV68_9EURY|nr:MULTISPECIES: HalX domain-containing protein [Halolamina]NHX35366.1 response regulator transcription factor [Halolamina sp. R1-12]SFP62489.1 DNA-binding response regulator, OmpR family, contains REC and winged-helix (wHTH) domain [Halolamina pelagica]